MFNIKTQIKDFGVYTTIDNKN